ncbi:MAG: alpha/beta hydrolase [Actinomycetota bacterium]|nr:alpha/beta hydrolase [Actinomycetota bacterium]
MTTADGDLAYVQGGEGTPLVLLHAFPFSRQMWRHQYDGLTTHVRLLTPDLHGFGESPLSTRPPDLGVMADGVLALLDRLRLDRVVLGGLSMGGYVAMEVLRRRPAVVGGLVLADTKASADPEEGADNRRRMADLLEQRRSPRPLVHDVLPTLVSDTTRQNRPDTVAWLRDIVESTDPLAAAWAQRAMAARPDSFETLRQVRVPTLVLVGDEDRLSPPSDAEAMVRAVPGAQIAVLAGAGHLSAAEAPAEFNSLVSDFVLEMG